MAIRKDAGGSEAIESPASYFSVQLSIFVAELACWISSASHRFIAFVHPCESYEGLGWPLASVLLFGLTSSSALATQSLSALRFLSVVNGLFTDDTRRDTLTLGF